MAVSGIVAIAIAVAGVAVSVWLLSTGASGRARVLGIIGTALILLGVLSRFAFQWMSERFLGQADDAAIISIMAADTVAGGVLMGAGLIVSVSAIAAAGRQPKL